MTELELVEVDATLVEEWRHVHNVVIPSTPLSSEEVRERLTRFELALARVGEEVVGCSTVRPTYHDDAATTVIVRVLPDHRRKGYGTRILELLLADLDPGTTLETVVWEANQDGMRFARSHGFVSVLERHLFPGVTEPFLTLRRATTETGRRPGSASAAASDERLGDAERAYELAVFGGDPTELGAAAEGLAVLEADVALARGRLLHARFLSDGGPEDPEELECFERARSGYAAVGDGRGEGLARFWIGVVHQVVRGDQAAGVVHFERALSLSEQASDDSTRAYVLRHLGIADHAAGRLDRATARLEESTALRRRLGFDAGVAANLIGLAYVARVMGRDHRVVELLDEARSLTAGADAAGVRGWVEGARADLGVP